MKKSPVNEIQNHSYLLQFAIPCANKSHGVATVVVCRHRGHAIIFVDEERDALDGAGSPQRLVEVLAAEVIVYLKRLEEGEKKQKWFRNQFCDLGCLLMYSF